MAKNIRYNSPFLDDGGHFFYNFYLIGTETSFYLDKIKHHGFFLRLSDTHFRSMILDEMNYIDIV